MNTKEQLVEQAAAILEGKKVLACAQAFMVSRNNDISLKEIGEICNRLDIKIKACQLGCFK